MAWKLTRASMDGCCETNWRCCHEDPLPPCLRELVMRVRDSSLCCRRVGTNKSRPKRFPAIKAGDREGPKGDAGQYGWASAGTGGIRHVCRTSAGSLSARLLPGNCRSSLESIRRLHGADQ